MGPLPFPRPSLPFPRYSRVAYILRSIVVFIALLLIGKGDVRGRALVRPSFLPSLANATVDIKTNDVTAREDDVRLTLRPQFYGPIV